MKNFIILLLAVLIILPAALFSQGCMEGGSDEGVSVVGFFQPQFEYMQGSDEMTFAFNRARIGVIGNIPYDISYYMFVEYSPSKGPNPYLLDAFITYSRLAPYAKFSFGQFKSPLGLERNTSCSGLYTINRSMVTNQLAMDRDMGLMVLGNIKKFFSYRFALMNGTGVGLRDDNKSKNFIGRFIFSPLSFLNIGGSFSLGTAAPSIADADDDERTRYGGELEIKHNNFLLQAEYIKGKDVGSYTTGGGCGEPLAVHQGSVERSGYYAQAMYMFPCHLQPVVKYEAYDANLGLDNDQSSIITFGFNYFVNEWTKIMVNYLYKAEADGHEIANDQILVQAQVTIQ